MTAASIVPAATLSQNGHMGRTTHVKMAYCNYFSLYVFTLLMLAMSPVVSTVSSSTVATTEMSACIQARSCVTCVSNNVNFNCTWCEKRSQCSDGLDRKRQTWLNSGCSEPENYIDDVTRCPANTAPPPSAEPADVKVENLSTVQTAQGTSAGPKQPLSVGSTVDYCKDVKCQHGGECEEGLCNCPPNFEGAWCQKYVTGHCQNIVCKNGGTCVEGITTHICDCPVGFAGKYCDAINVPVHSQSSGLTVGAIVCIILITLLVVGLFVWAIYAYLHPTSPSGLFILKAKLRIKGRNRGSNGVKYKYHQQLESNQIDIQL